MELSFFLNPSNFLVEIGRQIFTYYTTFVVATKLCKLQKTKKQKQKTLYVKQDLHNICHDMQCTNLFPTLITQWCSLGLLFGHPQREPRSPSGTYVSAVPARNTSAERALVGSLNMNTYWCLETKLYIFVNDFFKLSL